MVKRRALLFFIIFWTGLSLPIICSGQASTTETPFNGPGQEQLLQKLEGNWLREEYVAALAKTKSPQRAVQGLYEVQAVFQNNENQKFELNLIYNFHESIAREIASVAPVTENTFKISFTTKYGPGQDEYLIRVNDLTHPDKLTLEYPKGKFKFRKIKEKSAAEFVNNQVLSGQYWDGSGTRYSFRANQTAQWPQKSFTYRMGLDYVFSKNNYLWLVDTQENPLGVFYSYEWKGNMLYIFKASILQGEAVVPEKRPLFILEKTADL